AKSRGMRAGSPRSAPAPVRHATSFVTSTTPRRTKRPATRSSSPTNWESRPAAAQTGATQNQRVDCDVDDNNRGAQDDLHVVREALRIDHGQEVMLEKIAGIARVASGLAQGTFERGQRADAPTELDEC